MNKEHYPSESLFIVLSAPSGAGKTTLCRRLIALCPNLRFSTSYTTRVPRPGEEEGRDYFFISEESFKRKIEQGEFVEWVENYGQYYGTSKNVIKSFLEEKSDLIIDVEPRGARKLKEIYPEAIFIFVLPPSMEELKNRLIKRGVDGAEEIGGRLSKACDEIKEVIWYDYIIFNEYIENAIEQLHAIYIAEKTKRERLWERIRGFLSITCTKTP